MIKTMLLFCVMLITFSCSSKNEPAINGGGGGDKPIQENAFVDDPSLPPPDMDSSLLAWDGSTTVEPTLVGDTYEIENANEFVWIAIQDTDFSGKTIKLMKDINMNDKPFSGINSLAGTLEGNNKIIHNIKIDKPTINHTGLVSTLKTGGAIQNLTISEGSILGSEYVGGFVGKNDGDSTMISNVANYNVSVKASAGNSDIAYGSYVGGIIGYNANNFTIIHAVNSGKIEGYNYVGGIIGASIGNFYINITKVRNISDISGHHFIGGIAGASGRAKIKNAGNTGDVMGDYVGGLIGTVAFYPTTIENSYNYATVTMTVASGKAGTLVGSVHDKDAALTINKSYYLPSWHDSVGPNYKNAPLTDNSTELDSTKFTKQSTFTSWDFANIWSIGTLHPILK